MVCSAVPPKCAFRAWLQPLTTLKPRCKKTGTSGWRGRSWKRLPNPTPTSRLRIYESCIDEPCVAGRPQPSKIDGGWFVTTQGSDGRATVAVGSGIGVADIEPTHTPQGSQLPGAPNHSSHSSRQWPS